MRKTGNNDRRARITGRPPYATKSGLQPPERAGHVGDAAIRSSQSPREPSPGLPQQRRVVSRTTPGILEDRSENGRLEADCCDRYNRPLRNTP